MLVTATDRNLWQSCRLPLRRGEAQTSPDACQFGRANGSARQKDCQVKSQATRRSFGI